MEAQANEHLVSVLSVSPHEVDEVCSRLQQDKMTSSDVLCGTGRYRSVAEVAPVVRASLSRMLQIRLSDCHHWQSLMGESPST